MTQSLRKPVFPGGLLAPCMPLLAIAMLLAPACGSPPAASQRAQNLLRQGEHEKAVVAAEDAIAKHPKDATAWRVKVQAAMGSGNYELAATGYDDWTEIRGGSHDKGLLRRMALTTLWQGLQLSSPEIQSRSIEIIAEHKIYKLAGEVEEKLRSNDDLVAAAAAIALLRDNPGAPYLASELLKSANPTVRAKVCQGIAKKIGRRARADLILLAKDDSPAVRASLANALGRWKHKDDLPLLEKLAADSAPAVRVAALRALLAMNAAPDVWMQRAVGDAERSIRLLGILFAKKADSTDSLATLLRVVDDEDLSVALRAAVQLPVEHQGQRVATLEQALKDESWVVRAAALNAASEILPDKELRAKLVVLLRDGRAEVRLTAARVLLALGSKSLALGHMRRELGDARHEARLIAATELARHGDEDAARVLSELVRGTFSEKLAALSAHVRAKVRTRGLVVGLADDDTRVRLEAANALLSL